MAITQWQPIFRLEKFFANYVPPMLVNARASFHPKSPKRRMLRISIALLYCFMHVRSLRQAKDDQQTCDIELLS